MSEGLGVWSTLFLLGAYHGINPGMGWLFAVARGMQEHRTRAVAWSLPPIALGHALAIGVVVLIAELAQVAVPMLYIRIGVAVTLVGLGVYKLIRKRSWCGASSRAVPAARESPFSPVLAISRGAGMPAVNRKAERTRSE
jgi:threonine/homoserine/homoserine lactone efflux protein